MVTAMVVMDTEVDYLIHMLTLHLMDTVAMVVMFHTHSVLVLDILQP